MTDVCVKDDVIGVHEWAEKECRVRFDSMTYVMLGATYVWECIYCGQRRTSTTLGDRLLAGPPALTPPTG